LEPQEKQPNLQCQKQSHIERELLLKGIHQKLSLQTCFNIEKENLKQSQLAKKYFKIRLIKVKLALYI
jgi:hypothetical protein